MKKNIVVIIWLSIIHLQSVSSAVNCSGNHFVVSSLTRIEKENFQADFFLLCDSVAGKINNPENDLDHFIKSYGVRALCVAYDMTGKQAYLDACITWAKQMVGYQEKMIPACAYYMNYERKPGEEKGDWFVADGSCIAMGVLAAAVRCKRKEQKYLQGSVEKFAGLVMKNFIGSSGGVCNGGWAQYKGEWWCSSGLFGSLMFLLYERTGETKYLKTGLGIIDWQNKEDLTKAIPFPLSEQGPSMPMYFLESYSAGWPYIALDKERQKAAALKVNWCLEWIKDQQSIPISDRKWKPTEWWGSKFGGLPFHQYTFAKYLSANNNLKDQGDKELKALTEIIISKKLYGSQLTMFLLLSYARAAKNW